MPNRLTLSPVEASEGTSPSHAINSRGVWKRPRSPTSAKIVVAATRSIPRIAISAVTIGARDQSGTASSIALSSRATRLGLLHRPHQLLEGDALLEVAEVLARQPFAMRAAPGLLAGIDASQTQKECARLLALDPEVGGGRRPRPHEIAHRLVPLVRRPDSGQFAGPQQARQAQRVAAIGLDPVARLARNERGRDNPARVPELADQPIKTVAGWPRLVTEHQLAVLGREAPNELRHRGLARLDLAEKPRLARASALGQPHRDARLRHVHADENFAILLHGSPSLREALPGPSGQPSQCASRASRRVNARTYSLRRFAMTSAVQHSLITLLTSDFRATLASAT